MLDSSGLRGRVQSPTGSAPALAWESRRAAGQARLSSPERVSADPDTSSSSGPDYVKLHRGIPLAGHTWIRAYAAL